MKKLFVLFSVFSLLTLNLSTHVFANEETKVVCHYEVDEEGKQYEVCEEVSPYIFCSLECWDA